MSPHFTILIAERRGFGFKTGETMGLTNLSTTLRRSLRMGRKPLLLQRAALMLFAFALLTAANAAYAVGPDLVHWADCPPGPQVNPYFFTSDPPDPWPAHFQTSPVAGPSGGNCSLDVVSGKFMSIATSAGGFAFETPGEVADGAYTISFDMQWISGTDPWSFSNQEGNGVQNGLTFPVPYPGDNCWRHYEFTGDVGPIGPKTVMFVYQAQSGPQEIRIANLIMRQADNMGRKGLIVGKPVGRCCDRDIKRR
jgi:hypothetical protein